MLSLLRLRVAPAAFALRRPLSTLPSSTFRALPLRAFSTEVPAATGRSKGGPRVFICPNCRREGHLRKDCTAPTICVACGVEGHQRKDCPNPDPKRIEALSTGPKKCFRCGVEGHVLKECPQPAKCFHCGQTGHLRKECPTRPPPPAKVAPADTKPAATAAAA
ncbi:hypothetical protein MSAN_01088500 [Mycena sanguinolenta]|uniref:CCHC-type domain-containing protein n=1 Tax=Mycena sanguinolenta TaxID=230812 RepID=A0A8H7DA43_9AGAR|nr:hypothetical protein MSAN_01088500 [Mycena sanguinolenta]